LETADKRIDRNTCPDKKGVTERTPARETEEERRRRIRGKAIAEDINEGQIHLELEQTVMGASHLPDPILNEIPENQVYVEKVQNRSPPSVGKNLLNKATETVAPPSNRALNIQDPVKERNKTVDNGKQGIEEDQQLMSEEEITQIMEEYASVDLEMDDDMVDDDDLLDDMDDEDAAVPETQEVLIQNKKDLSKKGLMGEDTTAKEMRSTSSPAAGLERVTKSQKEKSKKDKPQASYLHKHRGAKSPDTKGLAASRKLASRGRVSPKGKLVRHGRPSAMGSAQSTTIPRFGVYPSAVRSRKLSSVSGSVGSQKPPSTQI
ncbi:unnamed protein product, partial [Brassica rapa subsp. narinosa]